VTEPLRHCLECGAPIYKPTKKFCVPSHQRRYSRRQRDELLYGKREPKDKAPLLMTTVLLLELAGTLSIVGLVQPR